MKKQAHTHEIYISVVLLSEEPEYIGNQKSGDFHLIASVRHGSIQEKSCPALALQPLDLGIFPSLCSVLLDLFAAYSIIALPIWYFHFLVCCVHHVSGWDLLALHARFYKGLRKESHCM